MKCLEGNKHKAATCGLGSWECYHKPREVSVLFLTSENTNLWKTVQIRSEEKGIAFLVSGGYIERQSKSELFAQDWIFHIGKTGHNKIKKMSLSVQLKFEMKS